MNLPASPQKPSWGLLPTGQTVLLAAIPAGLSLVALVSPVILWAAFLLDALVLLVLVRDAIQTQGQVFTIQRETSRIWSAGRSERITLGIQNPLPYAQTLEIHQTLFSGCEATGLPLEVRLPASGIVETGYRVRAIKRGSYHLGAHHIRYRSPWGFWQRQVDLVEDQEIQVWPDIKQLAEYDLLARSDRQGLMIRTNRRPGSETEFDRLRPYQRGDEYRLVDWKATARARQPVVRQLRQATDQTIVFMLDCGRTMTAETVGRSALDYALDATLLVAHVAAKYGDKASVIGFSQQVQAWLPPTGGPHTSQKILQAVCNLQAELSEPDYEVAFNFLKTRVRQRALVVLFSNLVDENTAEVLKKAMSAASRHLVVWVCLRDPGMEAMVRRRWEKEDDPWLRGAAAEVLVWRKGVLDRAVAAGVQVIDTVPGDFTPALLGRYLDIKSKQLL